MDRARRAGITALVGILLFGTALAGPMVSARPPGVAEPVEPVGVVVAAGEVGWPTSSGLVVAEVVTGGVSASDEWIELANIGSAPIDLRALELAYVTSSGATVTRKAAWTDSLVLGAGRHLLLANAAGVHAAFADVTYSGGLSASGGALVLRPVGGDPLDAVGWGDATNAFVEGGAAPAPPAGFSVERRPGGLLGHGTDSNDNASDFLVNPLPIAQDLGAPPVPDPSATPSDPAPSTEPSPSPNASPTPSADPSPTPSADPSQSPTPSSSASPSPDPNPTDSPAPSPSPDPNPTHSPAPAPSPSPTPTVAPSAGPSPEPSVTVSPSSTPGPVVTDIATARSLPAGTSATIQGVLTTDLGALEDGRGCFIQDPGAGIALYLDAPLVASIPAGTQVRVSGTLDQRYGQQTLRSAGLDIVDLGPGAMPPPISRPTGGVAESDEGRRLSLSGEVVENPTPMADGLGLLLDDGTGPLRVIVAPVALADRSPARGDRVMVVGPLGQRDSTGSGLAGYRLFATLDGELVPLPGPSPTPPASPSPTPAASPPAVPSPTAVPNPSAGPSPSPSSMPNPSPSRPPLVTIASARLLPVGAITRVVGIVTVEPGRIGKPSPFAMDDGTAGLVVHLPDGVTPPDRGQRIEVTGKLAAPYGQLEIKPDSSAVVQLGWAPLPAPLAIEAAALGEGIEARLVTLRAVVASAPRRATSGDLSIDVADASGVAARVMVDARAGIDREAFTTGGRYTFTGIVGQRASRIGALDGYRIWLRDPGDLRPDGTSASPGPTTGSGGSPSPSGGAGGSGDPSVLSIAGALATLDVRLAVEAVVIAGPALLDASGRRIVVQDPTGAIEVLMPDRVEMAPGARVRVTGIVGTAYGAPRLRADALAILGRAGQPNPVELAGSPGAVVEWRLARGRGLVVDVHRMGDRWTAELQVGGDRVLVSGLPGSKIAAGRVPVGSIATIVGIVRRPYPTATDRRFALVPRSAADISLAAVRGGGPTRPDGSGAPGAGAGAGSRTEGDAAATPRIDLGQLGEFIGRTVQVGGLVVEIGADGVQLDDGTARAWLVLRAGAAALLSDVVVGDAVSATGQVDGGPGAERVEVVDPALVALAAGSAAGPASSNGPAAETPGPALEAHPDASVDPGAGSGRSIVAGLVAVLVLLGLAAALGARRWLERRRLATRLATRLAAVAPGISAAERPPAAAAGAASVAGGRVTLGAGPQGPS